jgi:hypothetical protein
VLCVGEANYGHRSGGRSVDPATTADGTSGGRRPTGRWRVTWCRGGAAIGAIAGDAGSGAGIGAITGTMVGGRQARQQRAAQNQQAVGQQQEMINTFYRGFGACMEGRGYTIK